jgi:hypothetical protein
MIRFKNLVPGKCMPDSMDRGWFKRVYQAVKDDVSGPGLDKDELKKLAGYEAVLSYAIICGVGWMVAGALALVASSKLNKMLALVAGIIFAVLYCLHVALFGAIWDSVARVEDSCSNFYKSCDEVKAQAIRSSREFLAYAICAFVLILFSIIICLLFHMKIEEGAKGADKVVSAPQEKIANQEMAVIPPAGVTPAKKLEEPSAKPAPGPAAVEKKQEAPVSEAAAVADQFGKVNKYLCDDARMEKSAQKKFDAIDNDHSGKVAHAELKKFIAEVLAKKNLPSPDDRELQRC